MQSMIHPSQVMAGFLHQLMAPVVLHSTSAGSVPSPWTQLFLPLHQFFPFEIRCFLILFLFFKLLVSVCGHHQHGLEAATIIAAAIVSDDNILLFSFYTALPTVLSQQSSCTT